MMTFAKRLYNLDLKINCDILNDDMEDISQNTDTNNKRDSLELDLQRWPPDISWLKIQNDITSRKNLRTIREVIML